MDSTEKSVTSSDASSTRSTFAPAELEYTTEPILKSAIRLKSKLQDLEVDERFLRGNSHLDRSADCIS